MGVLQRIPGLRLLGARKGESWGQLVRLFARSLWAEGPRATWRRMQSYSRTIGDAARSTLPPRTGRSFALFVSGCPGHPRRWRCEHALEELGLLGLDGDLLDHPAADLSDYLDRYQVLVLQRVPMDPSVRRFLERARARAVRVIADVDDLVVDADCAALLPFAGTMTPLARELYAQQLRRIGEVLHEVGECMVPTRVLAGEVRARHPHLRVHLVRNVASQAMVAAADAAIAAVPDRDSGTVTFGYFSGTPTHQQDLDAIAPVLAEVLAARPGSRLLLAGEIAPSPALRPFADRVVQRAGVPWTELPALLRSADVHLVPLLAGSRFNAAKSELKYVEAALVGRPVLAAALGPYPDCIRHGDNGMLAGDLDAWRAALLQLAGHAALRDRLGRAARADALSRWTTTSAATELGAVLGQGAVRQER